LFDEELERILRELPRTATSEERERYKTAREISEELILSNRFNPE